jgi:hypothetical protein
MQVLRQIASRGLAPGFSLLRDKISPPVRGSAGAAPPRVARPELSKCPKKDKAGRPAYTARRLMILTSSRWQMAWPSLPRPSGRLS